jgi:hypothetical protein
LVVSKIAWRNTPTNSVDVGGMKMVYRQLGPDTGVPVIFLNHLAVRLAPEMRADVDTDAE